MLTKMDDFGIMADNREEFSMAATAMATYRCPGCGRVWNADRPLWRCACGSHLNFDARARLGPRRDRRR